jgi:predicted DNA-binding transcriptional regulator YafY
MMQRKLKLSLAQATDSVRNKFKELRGERIETNRLLEEQFKPITKRLTKLIDTNDKVKKKKPSDVYDDDDDDIADDGEINVGNAHVTKKKKVK